MTFEKDLSRTISERVTDVSVPLPNLSDVVTRGRARRRRRALGLAAGVGATASLCLVGALALAPLGRAPGPEQFPAVGRLNYSEGIRAFASPDENGVISIGGRTFPRKNMGYLDTDATATPYGVVFFDRSDQAHLLEESGHVVTLAPAPASVPRHFRPSSKTDARLPLMAFTQPAEDGVRVLLHDFDADRTIDSIEVPCSGKACKQVVVDGLDQGLVFVRTPEGTFVWDPPATGDAAWTLLGSGRFRLADVRSKQILWAYAPPSPAPNSPVAGWGFTKGRIDAELSYDGRHILYWSPRLKPTRPGDAPITLHVKGAIWFTFDTDGSVLAAASAGGTKDAYFDCELPSGRCVKIGTIESRSGDPVFIGNDM